MIPRRDPNANKCTYDKRLELCLKIIKRSDVNQQQQDAINYHFETYIFPGIVTKAEKQMSMEEWNIIEAETIKLCTQLADNAYSAKEISLEQYNIMKADIETKKNKTYQ
jgi:hypothetical protein